MTLVVAALAAAVAACALLWLYASRTFEELLLQFLGILMAVVTLLVLGAQIVLWVGPPGLANVGAGVALAVSWWAVLAMGLIISLGSLYALVNDEVHHRGIWWGRRRYPVDLKEGQTLIRKRDGVVFEVVEVGPIGSDVVVREFGSDGSSATRRHNERVLKQVYVLAPVHDEV